jgi:hypothetical protein
MQRKWVIALLVALLAMTGAAAQDDETSTDAEEAPPAAEITVIKSVSNDGGATWDDAQLAPGISVEEGDELHYLIQIVNSGDYALTGVTLTDTLLDTSSCEIPDMLEPGDLVECVVGPLTAPAGAILNTVLVTAQYNGETLTATDSAYAFSGDVAVLNIEKMVGVGGAWFAADNAPGLTVPHDGEVRFRITVSNDGTETFTGITLTDSMFPLDGCDIPAELPAGLSFECVVGPIELDEDEGALVNTATVTAVAGGETFTASDQAHFTVSEEDSGAIIIIEGPISEINGNIIVIFDIDIEIGEDDPILLVIQIGDVIRVEGSSGSGNVIIAIVVVIINVDIYVGDNPDQVYRDDGQCGNPPPPWAPAHGWRRKCQGVSVQSGSLPPGLRNKVNVKIKIKIK